MKMFLSSGSGFFCRMHLLCREVLCWSGDCFRVANLLNCLVKIELRAVFSTVAGAADLFNNTARAFASQSDDIAVSLGIRLLNMALSRAVAGLALHADAVWLGIPSLGTQTGNRAVEPGGISLHVCMRT